MTTLTTGAALIIGAAACVTDLHSRRIPNWLTFGAAAVGIATQFAIGGQGGGCCGPGSRSSKNPSTSDRRPGRCEDSPQAGTEIHLFA